jgi:rSAM/selenodomain-associated transferase 1
MNSLKVTECNQSILLFARYPEIGRVKTRLETHLDQDKILSLYRCFVEDILSTLHRMEYPVSVCYWPPERVVDIQAWLGSSLVYCPQKGEDIGERMQNAFTDAFANDVDQAILLGSDFPDLDPVILDQAFDALSRNDVTLGPAVDGGYYLIGFNRHTFSKEVFTGISWGTRQVFEETMKKTERAGLKVHLLPKWQDIDTFEDLRLFYKRAGQKGLEDLRTMQYLHTILS